MSEKEITKSVEQKEYTNERFVPFIFITQSSDFLVQCRELIDKDKLASPGDIDPPDGLSGSDSLVSSLTDQDLSNLHQTLFVAWKTKKSENTKVWTTLNPPSTWPPQRYKAIEDEETLGSFEDAKSKFDVAAYSQAGSRPTSPDLLDLYNSEIRVADFFPLNQKAKSLDCLGKADEKSIPKLIFRSQSWSNMAEEKRDQLNRETAPLSAVLRKHDYLDLSMRILEWSQADLQRRFKEGKTPLSTPSTSESEYAVALNLPPKLNIREFSYWLLSQSKKLFDSCNVPGKPVVESDEASQNPSSGDTTRDSSVPESSSKSSNPPQPSEGNQGSDPQQDLSPNPLSDDTLSEITPISTDSESAPGKEDKISKTETENSSSLHSTIDPTDESSGPKYKRERSPNDVTESSSKRKTI